MTTSSLDTVTQTSVLESAQRVIYVPPSPLFKALDSQTIHGNRSALVHSLILSCGLQAQCFVQPLRIATVSEALLAHSPHYLSVLRAASLYHQQIAHQSPLPPQLQDIQLSDPLQKHYLLEDAGLLQDCPTFSGVWQLAMLTVGGAVVAARQLIARAAKVACWFDGGRHHAAFDSASGFCYLNDIVVAAKFLLSQPAIHKLLYIDIDIHHADGTEDAFIYNPSVITLSFHLAEAAFFPGTGHNIIPTPRPPNCSAIRVPLRRGIDDKTYSHIFSEIVDIVASYHSPDVIIFQSGCDGICSDPRGGFNLTGKAYTACMKHLLSFGVPILVLGGGGYNSTNAARVWTDMLELCVKYVGDDPETTLNPVPFSNRDIPFSDSFFELYRPSFSRSIKPTSMRNENNEEYLRETVNTIREELKGEHYSL